MEVQAEWSLWHLYWSVCWWFFCISTTLRVPDINPDNGHVRFGGNLDNICCSNHSSLKDKWSHNKQSSPIGYQVKSGEITRELDKEPSLHCSSIYTTISWSMLQQCVYLMSIHHASTSCPITHPHVFSLRPLCFLHVSWHHTFNLCYTCAHYVYTMRNPCPLMSSLTLTPSRP